MPTYEYRCAACEKYFTVVQSMAEQERRGVRCPQCGTDRVVQQFSPFYARTSRKS